MKRNNLISWLFFFIFFLQAGSVSQVVRQDRQPAVAGTFYPSDSGELRSTVKQLFSAGIPSKNIKDAVALIVPHAGYVYSGEVAASGFNQIDSEKNIENVFIIGSSHRVAFEGASIYTRGDFITPLGTVKVNSGIAGELLKKNRVFSDRADAHTDEHSLEVQLPFLQVKLKKDFKIVPIVIGGQSAGTCKKIADALLPYFNLKNLFIISTDFSHYPSYDQASVVDKASAEAILSNSSGKLLKTLRDNNIMKVPGLSTSMCGWTSVLTLLYMTENNPEVEMSLIQYKNSGDSESGDKSRVVGYNSILASFRKKKGVSEPGLSDSDKNALLSIARETIGKYIRSREVPEVDADQLSENLKKKWGAFVTLHKNNELRGCIGRFEPDEPLYKVVQQMAVASSTEDRRFPPVKADEIDNLKIEISVLTPMKKIVSADEIELGRHGIYIKKGFRSGTFLPQVAAETGWSKEEFLGHCAQDKAGIGWEGWKDAEIFIYEAFVFGEK